MRGISVRFGTFLANDGIDLSVGRGEIHALLGENGAGKTTLMRVLAGLLTPAAGEIRIDGRVEALASPHDAMRLGVGMVHQHFMLVPTLTVAENVCLGLTDTGRFFPDLKKVAARLREIATTYGLDVDPAARVDTLSIAGQQRVEIVKALYRGARILVLDEPTAVLTPQETEGLFRILRSLAGKGTAIIFISHKLGEVMALTYRITVLRQGRVAATRVTAETDQREIARLMIGQEIALPHLEAASDPRRPVVLAVENLVCRDERGPARVAGASLTVRSGEIVGIAGVDGNGQQELAEAIVGLRAASEGTIRLAGRDVTNAPVGARIAAGLAHIPEDRHRTALVDQMSISDNAILELVGTRPYSKNGFLDAAAIRQFADDVVENYDVRCSGPDQPVGTLSGGNQQKVVLGRALSRDPSLIIAVQPVRGLDVGATAFVHRELLKRRGEGAAVLLISTELDEILSLSDRVVVMFKGRVAGTLDRSEISVERLGLLMAGQTGEAA